MPDELAACSHCGSVRVYPKIWVQGFFPGINAERQVYVCRDCGREGMLLLFATEEERAKFAGEFSTKAVDPKPGKPQPDAIPILPIDAVPLVEIRGIDAVPIYRPKVVDVRWTERRLRRGRYRVDVKAYWEAVGGARYNAGRIYVLDLGGVNHGSPDFDTVRAISKRATVLFDLGIHNPDEVMDGYMLDVEAVVAGTLTLRSLDQYAKIRDLSDGVLPCLDYADGVAWSELSKEDSDLRVVAAALKEMGYASLAVMDVRRLGTESGPDPKLLAQLEGLDFDLIVGGGIREEDVVGLREKGFPRALIDPFTPVIRTLLPSEREPVPADALSTPRPARDARGTPAPG